MSPLEAFVDALTTAFRSGDPDMLRGALAPDAVLWHNTDGVELVAAESVDGIVGLHGLVDGLHLEVLEARDWPGGGFVRFTMAGTVRTSGVPLVVRNCVFAAFDDLGRVTRMDEYVDPSLPTQLGLSA